MTEDNTKDGDQLSNVNSIEQKKEAGLDSDTPAEINEIGAETGLGDNPAEQDGLEAESPSGDSAARPDHAEEIEAVENNLSLVREKILFELNRFKRGINLSGVRRGLNVLKCL